MSYSHIVINYPNEVALCDNLRENRQRTDKITITGILEAAHINLPKNATAVFNSYWSGCTVMKTTPTTESLREEIELLSKGSLLTQEKVDQLFGDFFNPPKKT